MSQLSSGVSTPREKVIVAAVAACCTTPCTFVVTLDGTQRAKLLGRANVPIVNYVHRLSLRDPRRVDQNPSIFARKYFYKLMRVSNCDDATIWGPRSTSSKPNIYDRAESPKQSGLVTFLFEQHLPAYTS